MRKTIKLAVLTALALGSTSAFATNGSTMISTGAKATGMAGVGIGMSHGAESALVNPALITDVQKTEISFGGTFFMPDVSFDNGVGAGAQSSDADLSVVPMVAVATKLSENFYLGVGMWGTAGMGVDYRDSDANMNMVTNLQLMQFGVPLAYKISGFSIAVTPLLQYGALDINYGLYDPATGSRVGTSSTQGVAQDLEFGYNLGASYEIAGLTVGAVYKSEIEMEYNGQISQAMSDFTGPNTNPSMFSDKLSTPAEIGLGASYVFSKHTLAIDYKQIQWSSAAGYEDFAWDDQDVISFGYEFNAKTWAARLGYNYASSPITDQGAANGLLNQFNLMGFPAIIESHYSLGATYCFSEQTSMDVAYVYSPEVEDTYKGMMGQDITTKHSQSALSLAVNFIF
jgi:long-chain fatty acid transport protein